MEQTGSRTSMRDTGANSRRRKPVPVTDVLAGYSKLAAFVNLQDDIAIFRRFGRLHAQLLLYRQQDIEEIEQELQDLDDAEAEQALDTGGFINNRSWAREKDLQGQRVDLVKRLRKSMKAYDDELFRYKQKLALKDAADWQIKNTVTWMKIQRPNPLVPSEARFLEDKGDVCTLKSGSDDSAILTDALRSWARDSLKGFSKIFQKKGNPASLGDPSIVYYNTDWQDGLARLLYACLISLILVAAVVALYYIRSDEGRLACLCVSTFLCASVMAVFTTAKKGEIMGATAAYAAVLIVFIGQTLENQREKSNAPSTNPARF